MTKHHPNENGRLTENELTRAHVRETTHSLQQEIHEARKPCEPQSADQEQATGRPDRLVCQTVALWIFVAASFAAFMFASYLIWAKCRGASPF
jgi:hypothetical protein